MKKKLISLLLTTVFICYSLAGCGNEVAKEVSDDKSTEKTTEKEETSADDFEQEDKKTVELVPVTLNEVAHSIFYAPLYVAIEKGFFTDEGIDLDVVTGFGADKTTTALISNEAQIGFMGPETTIYTYQEGSTDIIQNFAQLTQRAGNFLVAREDTTNFSWNDLIGKEVLAGRAGGMPQMVFEYILKENNIDPSTDINMDQSIDFGATGAAFTSGKGDYTVEFEPGATLLEQQGNSYVVASLGVDSGYVPYTAFCAKSSYIEKNPEIIQSFTRAMQKGLDYCQTISANEIANIIAPQFPDTDIPTIETIVKRYDDQDTWKENLTFEEDAFVLLQDILESAGQLKERVEYSTLVTTEFID